MNGVAESEIMKELTPLQANQPYFSASPLSSNDLHCSVNNLINGCQCTLLTLYPGCSGWLTLTFSLESPYTTETFLKFGAIISHIVTQCLYISQ